MDINVDTFVKKIFDDAQKKVETDLAFISAQAKQDFEVEAKRTVMDYYAHYTPRVYIPRTNNLRDNVVDSAPSFSILNGKSKYEAWIAFSSEHMADYIKGSKDAVVHNFMAGIHGRPSIFVEADPAKSMMEEFQKGYKQKLDARFISRGYSVK